MASAFLYGTVIGSGQPVSWIKYAYLLLVRMYSSASRQIPLAVLFCFCGFLRSFVRYMIRTNNPQSDNEHECCHVEYTGANAVKSYDYELFMSILLTPLLQYAPAIADIIAAQLFHVLSYVT